MPPARYQLQVRGTRCFCHQVVGGPARFTEQGVRLIALPPRVSAHQSPPPWMPPSSRGTAPSGSYRMCARPRLAWGSWMSIRRMKLLASANPSLKRLSWSPRPRCSGVTPCPSRCCQTYMASIPGWLVSLTPSAVCIRLSGAQPFVLATLPRVRRGRPTGARPAPSVPPHPELRQACSVEPPVACHICDSNRGTVLS